MPPTAVFTAFSDLSAFTERPPEPLPERPTVIFVAALEPYKNIDGLAAAWRSSPTACRTRGSSSSAAARSARRRPPGAGLPGRVDHHAWLEPDEVADALDGATVLVLPSWPEGLGRVVIEAFARGRGVVATEAGGIPDLVTDGVEGCSSRRRTSTALAAALERVLADRELAARLGAAARERYVDWHSTPEELARALRELVDRDGRRNRPLRCGSSSSRRRSTPTIRCSRRRSTSCARWPARSRRSSSSAPRSAGTTCRRTSRLRTFGARPALGPRRSLRARARARSCCGAAARRRARPHGPALPRARGAAREAAACAAAALVHALARGRSLRLATRLADVVLSVDRRSFPLETPKLQAIGHAIDVERFTPAASGTGRRAAAPARARPDGALEGLRHDARGPRAGRPSAGLDATLEIRGPAADRRRARAPRELEAAVARLAGARDRVRIEPPLPRDEIPALLAVADALVSATQPRGSETLDKVVYEAAACGVPVLASNAALHEFLAGLPVELRFPPRDAGALADASASSSRQPGRRRARRPAPSCAAASSRALARAPGRTPSRRRCRARRRE